MKDVLLLTKKGSSKTKIRNQTNLTYTCTITYIDLLNEIGLVCSYENNNKIRYKITKKGRRFLEEYYELKRLLSKNIGLKIKACPTMC